MRAVVLASLIAAAAVSAQSTETCPEDLEGARLLETVEDTGARRLVGVNNPLSANQIFGSATCPSTCYSPSQADLQGAFATPTEETSKRTSSGTFSLSNIAQTAAWTLTSANNIYGGMFTVDYQVRDMCGITHVSKPTINYACNNPPVISARHQNVTLQLGAEVLIDARQTIDIDDDFSTLVWNWCLIETPSLTTSVSDTQAGEQLFTEGVAGYALLRPIDEGLHKVTVTVSDGCNIVQETVNIMVEADCCSNTIAVTGGDTMMWSGANTVDDVETTLTSLSSQEASCLPADYIFSDDSRYGSANYKSRYSPLYQDPVLGMTVTYNSTSGTTGCTWPGAGNFDRGASKDNGQCSCNPNTFRYNWPAPSTTDSPYYRQVDPTGTVVPVLGQTANDATLTFYSMRQMDPTLTYQECKRTMPTVTTTSTTKQTGDLRTDLAALTPNDGLLRRPSTSWDAYYEWTTTTSESKEWFADTVTANQKGEDVVACALTIEDGYGNNPTVNVKVERNSDFTQCLGRYTVDARSSPIESNINCPKSYDAHMVSVVCPFPPEAQILCTQNLLWDGYSFVRDPTATGSAAVASGDWVTIDARDTRNVNILNGNSHVQYNLSITQEPPMLTFNGANQVGGQAGAHDLGRTAQTFLFEGTTVNNNMTGAFLPTRGAMPSSGSASAKYQVTLFADDKCNPTSFDTVEVSTTCLDLTAAPTQGAVDTSATERKLPLNPSGTTTGLEETLNFAFRVKSRPTFMGDSIPGGIYDDSTVGAECFLNNEWNTIATIGGNGVPSARTTPPVANWNTITASLPIAGSWQFSQYVTDGCGMASMDLATVTVTCDAEVNFDIPSPSVTSSLIFQNGGWTAPTYGSITTPAGDVAPTRYAWFLTSAPPGDKTATDKIYTANTNPRNAPKSSSSLQTCRKASSGSASANSWTQIGEMLAADATNGGIAPLHIGTSGSDSPDGTALTPAFAGAYTFQVQGDNKCSYVRKPLTFTTVCNDPARFVCEGTTGTVTDPADDSACDGGSANSRNFITSGCTVTAGSSCTSPSAVTWDCVLGRYHATYVSMEADGGADTESANDITTMEVTVAAPTQSWLSVESVTGTVKYSIFIPDVTTASPTATTGNRVDTLADATNFASLRATLQSTLNVSVAAATSTSGYTVDVARVSIGPVEILDASCFVPFWGRIFEIQHTFTVKPPVQFAPRGTNYDVTPDSDLRPKSVYVDDVTAAVTSGAFFTTVGQTYPSATYFTGNMDAIPSSAKPANVAAGSLVGTISDDDLVSKWATFSQTGAAVVRATSFIPDYGTTAGSAYTVTVSIADNCPETTKAPVTRSYQFRATNPGCQVSSRPLTNLTSVDDGTSLSSPLSRTWISRADNFGDAWQYGGMLRPTPTSTAVYTTDTINAATSADVSCSDGTTNCATLSPTTVTVGVGTGSSTLVRLQGYGTTTTTTGYPIAGGLTFEASFTGVGAQDGSEVQLGCATHATAIASLNTITFFHTFPKDATIGSAFRIPIPDSCKFGGNKDLFLYQRAQKSAASYTLSNLNVWFHPTGVGMSPFCKLGFGWANSGAAISPPAEDSAYGLTRNGRMPLQDTTGSLANGGSGAISNAQITFQVQETQPSWINTCSAQVSSAVTVNLACKSLNPSLTGNAPAFNQAQFQFETAELAVSLSTAQMASTVLGDLRYTFEITKAPSGSMYNTEWIYNNLVVWKTRALLGAAYTGPAPAPADVDELCYDDLSYTWGTVTDTSGRTTVTVTDTNSTTTKRGYANLDSIHLFLRTKAYPDYTSWHTSVNEGGDQQNLFRFTQNSTTCFQPDYSGEYDVQVTLDDGCVTPQATTTLNIGACTNPTVQIMDGGAAAGTTITAAPITASGPKRIPLYGTVNEKDIVSKANPRARMIEWKITSWPHMADNAQPPSILNSKALYASFIPAYGAGDYVVTLTADDGCRPMSTTATKTVTITVPCAAPSPAPAVTIVQPTNEKRVADDMLTLVFQPNARAGDVMQLVGKPNCDTVAGSKFIPTTVSHTCTSPFTVKVLNVYPATLMESAAGQLVQITVAVGGDTAGIPKGLDNPLYRQDANSQALSVIIGGRQCGAAEVYDYSKGQIICRFLTDSPSTATAVPVTVTMLGISSAKTNTNGYVNFAAPMATRAAAMSGSSAPAMGATRIAVWGNNIAFDSLTNAFFEPSTTRIKINGVWCTDVMLYQAPVLFTSQGSLSCMLPGGIGTNLPVSVEVSFRYPGALPRRIMSTSANVFTYDAPMAVAGTLSPATGSGAGGYYATVSVRNLGAAYPYGMPDATAGTPLTDPYADLTLSVGGTTVSRDKIWVTMEETAGAPAMLRFVMPPGCGDMARVVVSRAMLSTADSTTVATFNYDDPFITCVGEPYVSAVDTACTRIQIDGYNLPPGADSLMTNVTFQNDQDGITGYCDNLMSESSSDYFRFNCRIPNGARAGDRLVITNKCGETNAVQFQDADVVSHGRTLQTSSGSAPSLPSSINIPTCGASFLVNDGSEFTYGVEPPSIPASEPQASGVTIFKTISGGSWRNQPFSNGAWLGIVLPLLIILLLAYPIYHFISNRQGGSVHEWTRKNQSAPPTSSSAGAGSSAPAPSRTRVTLNPVSSREASTVASQPTRQPAPAPQGTHDNL